MGQKLNNNARALLQGNITDVATSLTVEAGKADSFPVANTADFLAPVDWFKATIQDSAGNIEIVKVGTRTSGSGVMSVLVRGQEGTTARAFTAGAVVELRVTAADLASAIDIASSATVPGKALLTAATTLVQAQAINTGMHSATAKNTPDDYDEISLSDSAAAYALKKLTWAYLKATLKSYFDTLYAGIGTILTPFNSTPSANTGGGSSGASATYSRGDHSHPEPAAGSITVAMLSTLAKPLGAGQARYDITSGRVIGTVYTNTSGRSELHTISAFVAAGATDTYLVVNGLRVGRIYNNNPAFTFGTITALILPGESYYLNSGGATIDSWTVIT